MQAREITQLLRDSEITAGHDLIEKLVHYLHLLGKWNTHVNLTASTEWRALKPLIQECVWASGYYRAWGRHLDIGSGGGFPAIPLRLLRPMARLDLVESRTRRAAFLETVVQELALEGVVVHCDRLERVLGRRDLPPSWDYVTWKAIFLNNKQLQRLHLKSSAGTEWWVFHGREVPASEMPDSPTGIVLHRRLQNPDRKSCYMSIYRPHGPA